MDAARVLVFDPGVDDASLERLAERLRGDGWSWELSRGLEQTVAFVAGGDPQRLEVALASAPVRQSIPIREPVAYARAQARRRFLLLLLSGLGLLLLLAVLVPIVGFLTPPEGLSGDPTALLAEGALAMEPGTARVLRPGSRAILLVRRSDGSFAALSADCTHAEDCRLRWDPERAQLICPCHGDAF